MFAHFYLTSKGTLTVVMAKRPELARELLASAIAASSFKLPREQWETFTYLGRCNSDYRSVYSVPAHVMTAILAAHKGRQPNNPAAHEYLLSLGYSHTYHEADFEDTGNGESGPMVTGWSGYDEYTGPDEYIFISDQGNTDYGLRDLEAEKAAGEMYQDM